MKNNAYAIFALFCFITTAPAVTVTNGSFENLDSSYSEDPGWDLMSNNTAPGWGNFNSSDWTESAGPENLYSAPYGSLFMLSAATGTFDVGVYREGIDQLVTGFVVDSVYEISISHVNGLRYNAQTLSYEGVGESGGWQVLVDGTSLGLLASTNDNSTPTLAWTPNWQTSSVTFTATSASHNIQFVAYKPDGIQDPTFQFIDNVHVQLIPEPSAALLIGFGCLQFLQRQRRIRG
ncbi:MAG: hypothetical protein AAGA58_11120 [Verrucomicrobiota bacterium]